jgi:hypothetical protein
MPFDGRGPAEYVDFLTNPGLNTCVGPVPLTAYVSTHGRSPNAEALKDLFHDILDSFSNSSLDETPGTRRRRPTEFVPRGWDGSIPSGVGDPLAAGLNRLERMRTSIGTHGITAWRSVFTGQGLPQDIVEVMNFVVQQSDLMRAMTGAGHSLRRYFADGTPTRATLVQMVADEIFGMDCLGFVGTYLAWCGVRADYHRITVAQYATSPGVSQCEPVTSIDGIEARCILLWPNSATQHIAIIDRVNSRSGDSLDIDLCQSSQGGPQTNHNVTLSRVGRSGLVSISGGNPELPPVPRRDITVVKRRSW